MPVRYVKQLTDTLIRENRGGLILFGDNEARTGRGGQASVCRGKLGCHGVRTKQAPTNEAWGFWSDNYLHKNIRMIDSDLVQPAECLLVGRTVIIPSDGLGTGRARLREKAPLTFKYLQARLKGLELIDGVLELIDGVDDGHS